MTDQRQIDPSTLRDGDKIRVEWDNEGSTIGHFRRFDSGRLVLDVGTVWQLDIRESATITDILRPVLVKGDRVEWTNIVTPKQGTYVGPHEGGRPGEPHLSVVTNAEGRDIIVETDFLTRLPAAPEPAPIEVGDWWADEGGWPCVVVKIGPTGNPFLRRWTSEHPDKAPSPETLRAAWTRLDDPPEPPVGSVYVITNVDGQPDVWHHHANGLHYCAGSSVGMPWADACSFYTRDHLATLQIVHTLGVE